MFNSKDLKIALVYDRVNKWGGAERVLLALHELFPDAPLYTSVYNHETAKWAKTLDVKTSFLQHFPYATLAHEYYAPLMPLAFEQFNFDEYDAVISVTSESAKGIITKPSTLHICYCLTPTRYLWSGYNEYFQNPWFKTLSKPMVSYLRKWDRVASSRPDHYIAISREVQNRIKKYYGRESEVVYPPVELVTSRQQLATSSRTNKKTDGYTLDASGYFLIVSRLIPYKRIDIAIEACNELKLPLKIVGSGSENARLRQMSGLTIEFLGNLTDDKLIEYYRNCKALIVTAKEDLGLVALEAQSFGKPVIALKSGGSLETIVEGKTGIFFYPQVKEALRKILTQFDTMEFKVEAYKSNANRFSKENFKKEFLTIIQKYLKKR